MLPYIHIIVPLYGVCAALGMIAAGIFFWFRVRHLELGFTKILQIAIVTAIGVLVGSRIVFVITMIPTIIANFSLEFLLRIVIGGGFVFYGGLLGALLAEFIYCKASKINSEMLFQKLTPCFPLFHAFGRIGCFFSGCCYGIPCEFGFPMAGSHDVTRFPVQLLESFCCLLILAALLIAEKKKPGINLLRLYLMSYAAVRFCLEFLRGDAVRGIWGFFSTSQWISIGILLFCVIGIFRSGRKTDVKEDSEVGLQ